MALSGAIVLGVASAGAAPDATIATVPAHAYTLAECLRLADRNHPNVWAARARLAYYHAQLDEAHWVPYWQWTGSANFTLVRPLGGTAFYDAPHARDLNPVPGESTEPFFQFSVGGAVPLYTFGKIDAVSDAASAQVRLGEWELAKARNEMHMDVRRAYFTVLLARDMRALLGEVESRVGAVLDGIDRHMAKHDPAFDAWERTRVDVYRREILARRGDPDKGEGFGLASLRFMTGVQTGFDVVDSTPRRPTQPLGSEVQWLTAARLFRPEVNMARAGVVAREGQLRLQKARFFPDFGLGVGGGYSSAPALIQQHNIWVFDPYNGFFAPAIGAGTRWTMDIMANQARVDQVASQLEETRALERYALGGIAVEVEQTFWAASEADRRERSWASTVATTRTWMERVQAEVDAGKKDERALIEPLRAYVNAKINDAYARFDVAIAFSDLARACGRDDIAPD